MISIYALVDPFTEEIRYIGKSIRPNERLANHCNDQTVNYRTNWLRQLKAKGVRPSLLILQELPDDADWKTAEREWIAKGKAIGWTLTNSTSGGDGVSDLPPEVRKRMAQTWLGRKHRPESLKKIGAASKERYHTEEWRQYMHDRMEGRQFSEETRRLIRLKGQKLTNEQVQEIKVLLDQKVSQYRIAEMYGVHQGTISNIKRGLVYQDVLDTSTKTQATLFDDLMSEGEEVAV